MAALLEWRKSWDPTVTTAVEDVTYPPPYLWTVPWYNCGTLIDRVRRTIYAVSFHLPDSPEFVPPSYTGSTGLVANLRSFYENASGVGLWTGMFRIPDGVGYVAYNLGTRTLTAMDIDTKAITEYQLSGAAVGSIPGGGFTRPLAYPSEDWGYYATPPTGSSTVWGYEAQPVDGDTRIFDFDRQDVVDRAASSVVNPYNGDIWLGGAAYWATNFAATPSTLNRNCLHHLRLVDDFQSTIGGYFTHFMPTPDDTVHTTLARVFGVTEDYVWIQNQSDPSNLIPTGRYRHEIALIPAARTSEMEDQDRPVPYAFYQHPRSPDEDLYHFENWMPVFQGGVMYLFVALDYPSPLAFKVFLVEPPTLCDVTAGVQTQTGGGVSEVTPWSYGSGADLEGLVDDPYWFGAPVDRNPYAFYMRATDEFVLLGKYYTDNSDSGSAPFKMACTYLRLDGSNDYDVRGVFISQFMDADFEPCAEGTQTYNIEDVLIADHYRQQSDYDYGDDDSIRWLIAVGSTEADGLDLTVFVKVKFEYGADPVILEWHPSAEFDATYPSWLVAEGTPIQGDAFPDINFTPSSRNQGYMNVVHDPESNVFLSGTTGGWEDLAATLDPTDSDRSVTGIGTAGSIFDDRLCAAWFTAALRRFWHLRMAAF